MRDLAKMLEVDYDRLNQWKRGRGKPKDYNDRIAFKTWFSIENLEEVPESTLNTAIEAYPNTVHSAPPTHTAEGNEIVRATVTADTPMPENAEEMWQFIEQVMVSKEDYFIEKLLERIKKKL